MAKEQARVLSDSHQNNPLTLHYDRPATFFEEALVIGNGNLGAIIYGGSTTDKIALNDLTLWTGEPDKQPTTPDAYKTIPDIRSALDKEDYRKADSLQRKIQGHYSENYQPLGNLVIDYLDKDAEVTSYSRKLDISRAIATTKYKRNGQEYKTEYFASAPDSIIVIKITTKAPSGINARLSFNSLLPHNIKADETGLNIEGYTAYHSYPVYYDKISQKHLYDPKRGIHFCTSIKVLSANGTVRKGQSDFLELNGAKEVVILIANATSFNGFDKDPVKEGRDYRNIVAGRIEQASSKNYKILKNNHISDYKTFFDRVEFDLGRTEKEISNLPTDQQLKLYTQKSHRNPELEALYFQYGRYLLISCSRTPEVPANLQGLWSEKLLPPWSCNYTSNINVEENYWAAETANLSEMHMPLLEFIRNLSKTGVQTAQAYYGVKKGWCLGQNTDIWAMTCPVGLNSGDPSWACWTMGGAWISTHIWEHYLFTLDKQFLEQYYPVLKGAAEFCMNWLIEKNGKLMTSPGTSPENIYLTPEGYVGATSYGCTADIAISRECIQDAMLAAIELNIDKDFCQEAQNTLDRMQPYKIGEKGNLQEWYHDWNDQDPQHRHQSHLFGLYPGHHLSIENTPELAKACLRTLEIKGDKTTGWSTGWRINLYARLRDSSKAYHTYRTLLRYVSPDGYKGNDASRGGGTYPNLLCAHSPFQIDGNFGGCAGVVEMLMQSSYNSIRLLPAIPKEWNSGKISGICARGGYVISMEWKNNKVTSLKVYSRKGGNTTIFFNGIKKSISFEEGEIKKIL